MTPQITTDQVWEEINREVFCVLGMVTPEKESRTVGVVHAVQDRKLYIGTGTDTWKARHIRNNPAVSITVPIPKRIPLLPWIKIPAATITFSGKAEVIPAAEAAAELLEKIFRHMAADEAFIRDTCVIEVVPEGDFLTYGIGVPLLKMRSPEQARGRVSAR
jgi:general stress protein 26